MRTLITLKMFFSISCWTNVPTCKSFNSSKCHLQYYVEKVIQFHLKTRSWAWFFSRKTYFFRISIFTICCISRTNDFLFQAFFSDIVKMSEKSWQPLRCTSCMCVQGVRAVTTQRPSLQFVKLSEMSKSQIIWFKMTLIIVGIIFRQGHFIRLSSIFFFLGNYIFVLLQRNSRGQDVTNGL